MTFSNTSKINDWLDDHVQFQPDGNGPSCSFAVDGDDVTRPHKLALTLYKQISRNSRDHDFDSEYDEWDVGDARTQTFVLYVNWPESEDDLTKSVVQLTAYAWAHEALEWLRVDGKMPHDPHVDGDVIVTWP